MITLITALGSIIFALISVISYLFNKNKQLQGTAANQAVASQVSANDAKIQANNDEIQQTAAQTAAQEKGETNESIINSINSNTPKS